MIVKLVPRQQVLAFESHSFCACVFGAGVLVSCVFVDAICISSVVVVTAFRMLVTGASQEWRARLFWELRPPMIPRSEIVPVPPTVALVVVTCAVERCSLVPLMFVGLFTDPDSWLIWDIASAGISMVTCCVILLLRNRWRAVMT